MKNINLFLYEWKHFIHNPFKVIAVLLFTLAAVYGLHNGASLYHKQKQEIERIQEKVKEDRKEYRLNYTKEDPKPSALEPIMAIWFNHIYQFKKPASAIVYSIGQAEQYGFYKWVNVRSSPYDNDMTQEIANPERLNGGTIDFSFALLFLLPLVLLVLLYNIRSLETEQGFITLVEVQHPKNTTWLLSRITFYLVLMIIIISGLLFYGALLTNLFKTMSSAFFLMLLYSLSYLLFWFILYYYILRKGKSIIHNSLVMIGIYVLIAFIIPATVSQYLSIKHPANLMTDLIDVRDDRWELYEQPDSLILKNLYTLIPKIKDISVSTDRAKTMAKNIGYYALANEFMKKSAIAIEEDSKAKNQFIRATFWFNPISFYQNRLNKIAKTHFLDYKDYRDKIQETIDKQNHTMIIDTWNDIKVDQKKYNEYYTIFSE